MTARELINYLYRKGATITSPMYGSSLVFAKGALSNWRMFLLAGGYQNIGNLSRFIFINNLEDYEVRMGATDKLYRSNVHFERRNENSSFAVNIIRQR